MQQRGEQCPVSGGVLDPMAVQLALEEGDLVARGEDSASFARSLIGNSRSIASALVTPR